jgi:dolichol-phosphate mannosyltransferase
VYNEEQVLPELYKQLSPVLDSLDGEAEVVFVDDGSTDQSASFLRGLACRDDRVRTIRFSRNFGHQAAITAGLDAARGQAVVVMDADLQDPPELIPELARKWREGYEVVYAQRRSRRGESYFKRFSASIYYRLMVHLTKVEIPVDAGDFRLIGGSALVALRSMREKHRYVRGMVSWVGFRQTGVPYTRKERFAGETKYTLGRMLRFAADGITSFSWVPLRIAVHIGLIASALSLGMVLWVLYEALIARRTVPGWASTVVIILFLGGVQLFSIGMLGEYIGRVYDEVRNRPLYIIDDSDGADDD